MPVNAAARTPSVVRSKILFRVMANWQLAAVAKIKRDALQRRGGGYGLSPFKFLSAPRICPRCASREIYFSPIFALVQNWRDQQIRAKQELIIDGSAVSIVREIEEQRSHWWHALGARELHLLHDVRAQAFA